MGNYNYRQIMAKDKGKLVEVNNEFNEKSGIYVPNYRQIMARQSKDKKRWLAVDKELNEASGIYILTRYDADIKYAYVGQAKHILTRLAQHLEGYQVIDLSLKKHGLYSVDNPTGWRARAYEYPISQLDDKEREYIKQMAKLGYQLRNKTSGGQNEGKVGILENKPCKTYHDGLRQGEKNAWKVVGEFFDKYLDAVIKANPNKIKERKLREFNEILETKRANKGENEDVHS